MELICSQNRSIEVKIIIVCFNNNVTNNKNQPSSFRPCGKCSSRINKEDGYRRKSPSSSNEESIDTCLSEIVDISKNRSLTQKVYYSPYRKANEEMDKKDLKKIAKLKGTSGTTKGNIERVMHIINRKRDKTHDFV